jgi:hypothetical protein
MAGIPECADLRLEGALGCELKASAGCQAGCSEFGVYKKACATRLQKVCKEECTLDPQPACEDDCTETCTQQCDAGLNITCIHNCFGECSGRCEVDCMGADDPEQCVATCEANCDAECDVRCKPLVDGSCYKHCVECCGGSCTAQANMDCQQTCQVKEFEDCEYEFRVDCDASCSAEGSLFCDGEYALSGSDIPACAQALFEQGVEVANIDESFDLEDVFGAAGSPTISIPPLPGSGGTAGGGTEIPTKGGGSLGSKAGCTWALQKHSGNAPLLALLISLGLLAGRRRITGGRAGASGRD